MTNVIFDDKLSYAIITIKNSEKKNALNSKIYSELAKYINQISDDERISTLIIQSEGEDFTSGNDVNDFLENPEPSESSPIWDFVRSVLDFKKVLIFAVRGNCIGIGTTMIMHSDFAYASKDAKFNMPFLKMGLVPEFGSTLTFPKEIGRKKTSDLLILGKHFSAEDALKMSIINEISDNPEEKALETAIEISKYPAWAVKETKRLLNDTYSQGMMDVVRNEYFSFKKALSSEPVKLFFQNFLKRIK
jgi:enoyl-CoA hydratase/carnithine racemase